ncbi:MAG TPA: zinc-binding dehydrogenase [Candidatus Acidoferrales bacterium]|nr:zinc-binding dehydrogenase [Candidatus Acidoferrales bacterium]
MRAVTFSQHGGPEVLRLGDAPEPRIGPGEVLIRVSACALNHLDLWIRRGMPGIEIPLPHILGSDISGEIAEVGEGVTRLRAGQRVLLAPGLSCGECPQCLAGDDNLCRHYTVFGYLVDGGYAEYVKSPAANVFPIPANLDFQQAAAMPLVFLTAWNMLVRRARLQPGEHVLVLGGGSGVGSAAIQIAKAMGARVIATAGSEQKLAKSRELGADDAIFHGRGDFSAEVRRLTAKRGVDVAFEHTGTATWEQSISSLASGGRLVTCGATTGYDAHLDIRYLFSRNLSILGSYMGRRADLAPVLDLAGRGLLKPVVDCVVPLARAAEAHTRLESREQFGKIVLQVSG